MLVFSRLDVPPTYSTLKFWGAAAKACNKNTCCPVSPLLCVWAINFPFVWRSGGADASSEGVQRDLLPIIEGSVVSTKYGNVNTDHILFICSGAFHSCKPSDMLAELQGRLPIRVELKGLT